jgi:hypothetical protein
MSYSRQATAIEDLKASFEQTMQEFSQMAAQNSRLNYSQARAWTKSLK